MITYILIAMIHIGYGTAMTTITFHNYDDCEKAAKSIRDSGGKMEWTWAYCFQDNPSILNRGAATLEN